jgi:hypothetical protein
MIVYQSDKQRFLDDVLSNTIEQKILADFQFKLNRTTTSSEITSWKNSMMYMQNVLLDPEIPANCGIAIEYKIPLTSKRIDFILSGMGKDKKGVAVSRSDERDEWMWHSRAPQGASSARTAMLEGLAASSAATRPRSMFSDIDD